MKYILIDIDHTLSNAFWRDGMIGVNSWDEYHAASVDDKPIHEMVTLVNAFADNPDIDVVGITARPEKWRRLTMDWLLRHNIELAELLMRPDDEYRPSPQIKLDLVRGRFADPQADILMLIEDRDDVVEAFRSNGITALQAYVKVHP